MNVINAQLLDTVSNKAKESLRLRMNYNFHKNPTALVQRMLNAFQPGTYLRPHRHPDCEEIFIILRGKLTLLIFDDAGNVLERISLCAEEGTYGAEVSAMTWHTVIVNVSDTVIYELKQGPYKPLSEEHFAPWSPSPENFEEIENFLHQYCR